MVLWLGSWFLLARNLLIDWKVLFLSGGFSWILDEVSEGFWLPGTKDGEPSLKPSWTYCLEGILLTALFLLASGILGASGLSSRCFLFFWGLVSGWWSLCWSDLFCFLAGLLLLLIFDSSRSLLSVSCFFFKETLLNRIISPLFHLERITFTIIVITWCFSCFMFD